jgi:type II secretory pathway pseudopilin PulG
MILFLKLLSPIVAALLALLAIWWPGSSTRRRRITITVLTVVTLGAAQWTLRSDYKSGQWTHNELAEQGTGIKGIRAAQGDQKALEEFQKSQETLMKRLAETSSSDFLESVNRATALAVPMRKQLDLQSPKIAAEFQVSWQPVVSYILNQTDARLSKLKEGGYLSNLSSNPSPIISTEVSSPGTSQTGIRIAQFAEGSTLTIEQRPAHIAEGRIVSGLLLSFNFTATRSLGGGRLLSFSIRDALTMNTDSKRLTIQTFSKVAKPLEDAATMKNIESAISEVLTYCAIESKAGAAKSPVASP